MRLRFDSIKIENFMSLGSVSLTLDSRGYVLVSGVNNNKQDSARSNGSGKSSLFDAIMWCITGQTIRGNKDVSNMYGNDGALVEVCFYSDKHSYVLLRSKNHSVHKTNLKIYIDGEDKSGKGIRDSEKLLQEYLPDLTQQLLGSVILLGQGLPSRFTNNSPSGRKEILEKLCKSDFMIQDLKERISDRKSVLDSELRKYEDASLSLEVRANSLNEELSRINQQLSSITDVAVIDTEIEKLKIEHDLYIKDHLSVKAEYEKQEAVYKSKIEVLNRTSNEENQAVQQVNSEEQLRITELNYKIRELNAEIKRAQNELCELQSIKDVCPTCGQKIVGVVKPDTSPLEELISKNTTEVALIQQQRAEAHDFAKSKIEEIHKSYEDQFQSLKKEVKDLNSQLSEKHDISSNLADKAQDVKSQIQRLEDQREWILNNRQNYIERTEEITEALKSIAEEQLYKYKTIEDLKARQEIVSKFNSIVSREFRGYLLSGVIEYINRRAKIYSVDIFGSELIEFCLDGNNISISFAGKEYESLSGGEKQKVDLVVQFSIRDMLCTHSGFSTNIIVLDEIFDNLDDIGCAKVIDMISSRLSDVSSIFIVTHHGAELSIPCDDEIVVVKESNGVSYLQ